MNGGGQIGAFFDLDGTLLVAPSLEWRFIGYLLARDKIGIGQIVRWTAHCAQKICRGPRGAVEVIKGANKFYLAGLPESLAMDWEKSHMLESAAPGLARPAPLPVLAEGLERVAWHSARGHRIFFVTGTIEPLAHALECLLVRRGLVRSAEISATRLETRGGFWTGRIAGKHMIGCEKAISVRAFAARHGLALGESYAYGDSFADLPMLETVGHPVAVNPQARLGRIARRRGWVICRWHSPDSHVAKERPRPLASEETR